MKHTYYIIFILTIALTSCSKSDEEIVKINKDINRMNSREVVKNLLMLNDFDYKQLGRIFNCSISTIKRVENKESVLTEKALKDFKSLLISIEIDGKDNFRSKDPFKNNWIYTIYVPFYSYWWLDIKEVLLRCVLWIITLVVIGGVAFFVGYFLGALFGDTVSAILGIVSIIASFYFLGNFIYQCYAPDYLFLTEINPLIEIANY
ncbi:MAG: hypothetical protein KGV44_03185 [Flavobacteriaceae bacterium]|nr:hypothetical protein [Flavobacteriaceae bacterium]